MNDNAIYMIEIESRNRIVISKSRNATWEQVLELAKQNLKEVDTEQRELTPKEPSPS